MNVEEILKTDKKIRPESRTIIHLLLVYNEINERVSLALKPYGVSIQQFNVLRILRGQKGIPANLSTLNERMITKNSNTTRLVDKLVLKDYVEKIICPTNRRKIEITITSYGEKVLKEMDGVVASTEEELLDNFNESELLELNHLLNKF